MTEENSIIRYLAENYSEYSYELSAYKDVSGIFPGYKIAVTNGCAVYAAAAIVKYYLGSDCSYESVVNRCKSIALNRGFARDNNFYIHTGRTAAFVNACIKEFGLEKKASSTLLLSSAKREIDSNRPCILNIAYCNLFSDHAVACFGYCEYSLRRKSDNKKRLIRFYKIKDGYSAEDRYLAKDSIKGVFVTRVR